MEVKWNTELILLHSVIEPVSIKRNCQWCWSRNSTLRVTGLELWVSTLVAHEIHLCLSLAILIELAWGKDGSSVGLKFPQENLMRRQDWKPLSLNNHIIIRANKLWGNLLTRLEVQITSTWPTFVQVGYPGCFLAIVFLWTRWSWMVSLCQMAVSKCTGWLALGLSVCLELSGFPEELADPWWVWRDWMT